MQDTSHKCRIRHGSCGVPPLSRCTHVPFPHHSVLSSVNWGAGGRARNREGGSGSPCSLLQGGCTHCTYGCRLARGLPALGVLGVTVCQAPPPPSAVCLVIQLGPLLPRPGPSPHAGTHTRGTKAAWPSVSPAHSSVARTFPTLPSARATRCIRRLKRGLGSRQGDVTWPWHVAHPPKLPLVFLMSL